MILLLSIVVTSWWYLAAIRPNRKRVHQAGHMCLCIQKWCGNGTGDEDEGSATGGMRGEGLRCESPLTPLIPSPPPPLHPTGMGCPPGCAWPVTRFVALLRTQSSKTGTVSGLHWYNRSMWRECCKGRKRKRESRFRQPRDTPHPPPEGPGWCYFAATFGPPLPPTWVP